MSGMTIFITLIRRSRRITVLLTFGALSYGSAVYGHHSFAAFFQTDETTSIKGVVTEFWFRNPHARIYLDVTTETGEVEEWMAEGGGRNVLTRRGRNKDTIKLGMELIVTGSPSRDGSRAVGWNSLTTADGSEVGP